MGLLVRIEGRKYLCTVEVLVKTLEELYVLMKASHITYISAFQIMDRTSWRGWETEICWTELSSALRIGPEVWLEAAFTLSGQPNSWPKPFRHLILRLATRCCLYWSVRCNTWRSAARHRSQWTSSPTTPLVWFHGLKVHSFTEKATRISTDNLNLSQLTLAYHKYWMWNLISWMPIVMVTLSWLIIQNLVCEGCVCGMRVGMVVICAVCKAEHKHLMLSKSETGSAVSIYVAS